MGHYLHAEKALATVWLTSGQVLANALIPFKYKRSLAFQQIAISSLYYEVPILYQLVKRTFMSNNIM